MIKKAKSIAAPRAMAKNLRATALAKKVSGIYFGKRTKKSPAANKKTDNRKIHFLVQGVRKEMTYEFDAASGFNVSSFKLSAAAINDCHPSDVLFLSQELIKD